MLVNEAHYFDGANKIWKRISKDACEDELKFSLEIHKKLLSFFANTGIIG
ncbi:MAG: hypothetical protein JWR18_1191 [Segetibacter sp.]|nr:hypothetical protein [Segetibacter sp.]